MKTFTTDEVIDLIREHAESVAEGDEIYQMACRHLIELFEMVGGKKTLEELFNEKGVFS